MEDWQEIGFDFTGFEWDEEKAIQNARKHGVRFEAAKEIFEGRTLATVEFVGAEERYRCLGVSGGILCVVVTERGDYLRIISAREATSTERGWYRALIR